MKSYFKHLLTGMILLVVSIINGQQLMQGTIKPGAIGNQVDIYLKPNFNNNTEYIFEMGLPMAFTTSTSPTPTIVSAVLDPAFVTNFCGGIANQYAINLYNLAHNTAGYISYYVISAVRGGTGASLPQTWTS